MKRTKYTFWAEPIEWVLEDSLTETEWHGELPPKQNKTTTKKQQQQEQQEIQKCAMELDFKQYYIFAHNVFEV